MQFYIGNAWAKVGCQRLMLELPLHKVVYPKEGAQSEHVFEHRDPQVGKRHAGRRRSMVTGSYRSATSTSVRSCGARSRSA